MSKVPRAVISGGFNSELYSYIPGSLSFYLPPSLFLPASILSLSSYLLRLLLSFSLPSQNITLPISLLFCPSPFSPIILVPSLPPSLPSCHLSTISSLPLSHHVLLQSTYPSPSCCPSSSVSLPPPVLPLCVLYIRNHAILSCLHRFLISW